MALDGEPAGASLGVPLLRLPHAVEQFDHLLVDDEDDGHVQAHPAEPGNGSLVKPAQKGAWSDVCGGWGAVLEAGSTHACGPSCFRIWKAQSAVFL